MVLIIMLYREKIISIDGERDSKDFLKPDTITCIINPLITQFFKAAVGNQGFEAENIVYSLKFNAFFKEFLKWEKINYLCEKSFKEYKDTTDKNITDVLEALNKSREITEMELQRNNVKLDLKDSISVKINPDYLGWLQIDPSICTQIVLIDNKNPQKPEIFGLLRIVSFIPTRSW